MNATDVWATLQRDGYALVPGVIDPSACRILRARSEHCRQHRHPALSNGQWNSSHSAREDTGVRRILLDAQVAGLAAAALRAGRVWLFEDTFLVKEPGACGEIPWHQDAVYYPVAGDDVVTVWIALDDVNPAGGALRYVRGSHRWCRRFVATEFTSGLVHQGVRLEPIPDLDEADVVTVPCRQGDALVHLGQTLHGSGPNLISRPRRALSASYLGPAARWAPPSVPWSHPCRPDWERHGNVHSGLWSYEASPRTVGGTDGV